MSDEKRVVLTDPQPLPKDGRCPRCRDAKRVLSSGFGAPHEVCGKCGYDFPQEDDGV